MDPIICAVLCVVVAILTWVVAITYRKKVVESKIGSAESRAREIIDDAVKAAEATKKEALLEVKEESLKAKNEFEKESKERRAELQKYEKRVLSKEETVDKKAMSREFRNWKESQDLPPNKQKKSYYKLLKTKLSMILQN